MIDLKNLTIVKANNHLKRGDFSSTELTSAYLEKIKKENGELNAYLEVYDDALSFAKEADDRIKNGKSSILTGIPFSLKDNILNSGKKVSASSKILENYVATYDATVVKKLKKEGVVFLGRTNMDEFAMGGSTENSAYGVTRNPYDKERVPGGSSGGSAVSLASDMTLASLGTDTGGSIRQPASFCGVVGLKGTYDTVSRFGAIAMGSSLDQIGPFAKTVEDAEIIFNAIKGEDNFDSNLIEHKSFDSVDLKKRIGVPYQFIEQDGIDPEVRANFDKSILAFKENGYEIVDVKLEYLEYSLPVYYIIMPAEASTNLSRFDGIRFGLSLEKDDVTSSYKETRGVGFGKEVIRRIMLGAYVLSHGYYDAYYNKAILVRKMITNELKNNYKNLDAIVTPTSPIPPFKINEKSKDPLAMYLSDIFTVSANIGGFPAISIPSGFTKNGLPLGIQFMADHMKEDILFSIGKDFEKINR